MSISTISRDVDSYDTLSEEVSLEQHGFADEDGAGREGNVPDTPGEAPGTGYGEACTLIRTLLDDWLRTTPPLPLEQISFPPLDV